MSTTTSMNISNNCSDIKTTTTGSNVSVDITDLLQYGNHYILNILLTTVSSLTFSFNISKFTVMYYILYYHYLGTYHVTNARVIVATNDIVCIECTYEMGSLSTGCYVIFNDITSNHKLYKLISRSLSTDINVHDCISDLPNGVYNISILDSQSYNEGDVNNIALSLDTLITISHTVDTSSLLDIQTSSSMYYHIYYILISI